MRFAVVSLIFLAACLPQVGPPIEATGGGAATGGGTGGGTTTGGGTAAGGGASCTNGVLDGTETAVDCGGPTCPACTLGATCTAPTDCASGVCIGSHCTAAATACRPAFARCTTFDDLTGAASPTIRFPVGGLNYSPACVKVRLGQTLTFSGDFGSHPLDQSCGPVRNVVTSHFGNTWSVTFTDALGLFGYYCNQHGGPDGSGMAGAIEVVP